MSTSSTGWNYSYEHGKYYRNVYINGQWQTVWQEDDTTAGARSHNRVDSGTYERTAPGIDQMISSNQPATLDRTPPALQYPHTNASATHLSYAPVTASSTAGVYGASYVSNASVNSNHNHSTYSTAYTPFPEHPGGSILPDRGEGLRVDRTQTRHPREQLDPSYFERTRGFFVPGRVFSVLFTEAAGSTVTAYNDSISRIIYGELAHSQIRRFVVVRQKHEFCFACPIFTYSNQGTTKPGVRATEHSVIYTNGYHPILLQNETGITKDDIAMDMTSNVSPLSTSSRLRFSIHHPIQYNVKVKDLGMVCGADIPKVVGYWNEEKDKP